jgi:putative membrane protein
MRSIFALMSKMAFYRQRLHTAFMKIFRGALDIARTEAGLFSRFPKLRLSVIGIIVIPALYALIYLSSVWDPAGHTAALPAIIVNLDAGVEFHGQKVNMGRDLADTLQKKHTFGFTIDADEAQARHEVRVGRSLFALIIPRDFSANAVPGERPGGGKLVVYASEGNNYTGAGFARRFASELGHQVNETLNEKRWSLVLGATSGASENVARLREGVAQLRQGSKALESGLVQADNGSGQLATGSGKLAEGVSQLTDGMKQLGSGVRTMEAKKPAPQDLQALKGGAAQLADGHLELGRGLTELESGAQKLTEGAVRLRDETKGIPIVGTKVSAGAGQLADGAGQLKTGLHAAHAGAGKLSDGAQGVSKGVAALTDGMTAMGNGVTTMAAHLPPDAKLDELAAGSRTVADGARSLNGGLGKLRDGSRQLAAGLDLLATSLPANVETLGGTSHGLAVSVEPEIQIDAPVANNGTGFAPNFLPVALWLGAVMTAFIFHLRRLPEIAALQPRPSLLFGKFGLLAAIVLAQAVVVFVMATLILDIHVIHPAGLMLTLGAASLTFMLMILALVRAFGDAGKALALILLILQLSSAGGIMPIELSSAFFRELNPWLPFTWVVRAVRASMFGAYDNEWRSALGVIALSAAISGLAATFVGRWRFVTPDEHRPAMDI